MWWLVASLVALAEVAALNPVQQRDKSPSLVQKRPFYTYPNTDQKVNTTNETQNPPFTNLTYSTEPGFVQHPQNQNDYDLKIKNDKHKYKTNENRIETNKSDNETAEHDTDNASAQNETEVSTERVELENIKRRFLDYRGESAKGEENLGNRPRPLINLINRLVDDHKSQVKYKVNEQKNIYSLEESEDNFNEQTHRTEPRLKLIKILSLKDPKKREKLVRLWMKLYGNQIVKYLPNKVRKRVSNNYYIYLKPTRKAVKWLYNLWIQHKLEPENFGIYKKSNQENEMKVKHETVHEDDVKNKTDIDLSDINTAKQDIVNTLKVAFGKWITQYPNLYKLPISERWLKFKNYLTQNHEIDIEFLEKVIANILKEDEYSPAFKNTLRKAYTETQYDDNEEEIKEQKLSIVNQQNENKHKPIQITPAIITHDDPLTHLSRQILDNYDINMDDTVDGPNSLDESKLHFPLWLLQHPEARQLTPAQQHILFMLDPQHQIVSKQALKTIINHAEDRNTSSDKDDNNQNENQHAENSFNIVRSKVNIPEELSSYNVNESKQKLLNALLQKQTQPLKEHNPSVESSVEHKLLLQALGLNDGSSNHYEDTDTDILTIPTLSDQVDFNTKNGERELPHDHHNNWNTLNDFTSKHPGNNKKENDETVWTQSTPDADFILRVLERQSKVLQESKDNSVNTDNVNNDNVKEVTPTINALKPNYLQANSQNQVSGSKLTQMPTNGYGFSNLPTATFDKHPVSYSSGDNYSILDGDLIKKFRNQLNLNHNGVEPGSPSNYPVKEEPKGKLDHNSMTISPYLLDKLYTASEAQKHNDFLEKFNTLLENIKSKSADKVLTSNENPLNSFQSKNNISPVQSISNRIHSINNNNFHNKHHHVNPETFNIMDKNIETHDNNNGWNTKESLTSPTKIVGAIRGIVIENPKTGNRTLYQAWENPSQEELNKMLALTNRSDLRQYYYRRQMEAKSNELKEQNMENRN